MPGPVTAACDCREHSCPLCLMTGKVRFARLSEPREREPEPGDELQTKPVKHAKPTPKSLFD